MKISRKIVGALVCSVMISSSAVAFAADNQLVTIDLWNAVSDQASMGNIATDNNGQALYNPDENTLQIGTNPVDVSGFMSAITKARYDTTGKGNYEDVTILTTDIMETGTKNDGTNHVVEYLSSFEIELPSYLTKKGIEYIPLQMSVPYTPMDVVVGTGYLDSRLRINWDEMEATTLEIYVPNTEMSSGEVSKVEYTDVTTGIEFKADTTAVASDAIVSIVEITSGDDYNTAKSALGTTDFDLYKIVTLLSGVEQEPSGAVEIVFQYANASEIELYRINDDGSKTVLRGMYKDNEYTISSRSLGLFAVVGGEKSYVAPEVEEVVVETPVIETTTQFTDMTSHWAKENVAKAVELGLFSGITETTFAPNDSMTNAMAISVLYRVAGTPEVTTTETQWYAKAVAWGISEGIVGGYNDFVPTENITRQELATMLYRYELTQSGATERADLSGFTDANDIATWAEDAFAWANAMGIINGMSATTLAPTEGATRAQVATMFVSYTS
ncbi:S-layer homology domain-containing protein [Chakrabartyella piscis]|uniref:S-layer homology domain-containing protein n=1 Tax=Chakrabartyella piscis TaxID=2918914 RepID=UPI002958BB67|nr:S-layer homology domain-containing protein [Chakrabartyella piscis]